MEERDIEKTTDSEKGITEIHKGGSHLWVWVLVLLLVIVCLYFLSLINSKKFLITEKNGYLIVKKGLFLPYGFTEYIPQDMTKREAYSPIKIPEQESVATTEVDRGELDIVLFRIISSWIEKMLKEEGEESLKMAAGYIERIMRLNVSPDDFERYSRLKGELTFRQAQYGFKMGIKMIKESKDRLLSIKGLSPEFKKESDDLLMNIDKIEKVIQDDYILMKREDYEKIREEIKKECISSCVKEAISQSMDNPPRPSINPEGKEGPPPDSSIKKDEK